LQIEETALTGWFNPEGIERLKAKEFIIKDEEIEKLFVGPYKISITYPADRNTDDAQNKSWNISDGWTVMYWREQYYNCGMVNFYNVPYPCLEPKRVKTMDFLLRNFMMYNGYGVAAMNGYKANIDQFVALNTGWVVAVTAPSSRRHSEKPLSYALLSQKTNMNVKGVRR
jgi:hypothetical protein